RHRDDPEPEPPHGRQAPRAYLPEARRREPIGSGRARVHHAAGDVLESRYVRERDSGLAIDLAAALPELLRLFSKPLHDGGGLLRDAVLGGVVADVLRD